MLRIIIFDSDPAGLACHDPGNPEGGDLRHWMIKEWTNGSTILIPAIIDYEVRRELIFKGLEDAVARLDALYDSEMVKLLSVKDAAMRRAAQLWADARRKGEPTAHDHALDGDVILCAQAREYCTDADDWLILTENVRHIARYVGDRARSRKKVVGDWISSPRSIIS